MGRFSQQVAWITGGGTGIGKALAVELGRQGATVVVSGRRLDRLEDAVAAVEAVGAQARAVRCDVTDEQSVAGREEERERGDAIHRRKRRNSSVVLSTTSHDDGTGPRVRTGPRPSSLWSRVP